MSNIIKYYIVFILVFISCEKRNAELFDIIPGSKTGIDFSNVLTDNSNQNILDYLYYYNGGGIALGDINNDGLIDIYFSASQRKNKLYLNKGGLKFEDVTESSGISGNSTWSTGVSMVDINSDGFLDIYVCAVTGLKGFNGHNELFINKGDGTFTEESSKYGLDLQNYSTSSAFFDYDLDGDIDMYLLNHAVHTQDSYGNVSTRLSRHAESGDKLFRNDNGKFVDVSEDVGIYGGANGYGLGISVSDFNLDGYPDIYVSNDFHEDDYFYLNMGNGSFKECLKEYFGHTSKFSMGSDSADINEDGYPDILTLDMLPKDENILKKSDADDNLQMHLFRTEKSGYHNQYSRNMLQINREANYFTETALLSGIESTDWSWSALFADYDQDGTKDLFISNGIPKRPNDLDYINYISNDQIKKKLQNTNLVDKEALSLMPDGYVNNNFFKGNGDLKFIDKSKEWVKAKESCSNGAAIGDLDNDGDLDIVTNNINSEAFVYVNRTNSNRNYLKLNFKYIDKNLSGIGTKVFLYQKGKLQFNELFPQRGFQSSSEAIIHFGVDISNTIDSLKIIWPNQTVQKLTNIKANQQLIIEYKRENSKFDYKVLRPKQSNLFYKVSDNLGIEFKHNENRYIDSNRHKLIPYQISDRGVALSVGDLNNDGKEDIFFGNGKRFQSEIYIQEPNGFIKKDYQLLKKDSVIEPVSAIIKDFTGDKKNDLFFASGGGEFFGKTKALENKLYEFSENDLISYHLPENFEDTSVIKEGDYDDDGDLDIFIGNACMPNDFGAIPESYILENINGQFVKKNLGKLGMVRDAIWTDFNNDNKLDLIVIGEWMPPVFLQNNQGQFSDESHNYLSENLNGLWRAIIAFDIDNDGDQDYLLGNWGTNTKFKASSAFPMKMYYSDFDNNSKSETIVAIEKNKKYYPLVGLDQMSSQLVSLTKKKFTTYKSFAGETIEQIIDKKLLENATLLEVHTLASGILKNNNGTFNFEAFNNYMQVAPINCFTKIIVSDIEQILCGGNYFGVTPYHGRFDGFSGALIENEVKIEYGHSIGLDFFNKVVSKLRVIEFNNEQYLIALIQNDDVQVYKF